MRAIIAIVLLFVVATPVQAKSRPPIAVYEFPFDQYRIEVYRNGGATTIADCYSHIQNVRYCTTTGFSNRQGGPAGLFRLAGYTHQGNFRKRGFFQVDQTGRLTWISYALHPAAFEAFAAGPVIKSWEARGKSGTYIAKKKERFDHSFITANTERSVFCIDKIRARWVAFRFRGSLWRIGGIVRDRKLLCLNTDGGSQLALTAVNPATLAVVYDPQMVASR